MPQSRRWTIVMWIIALTSLIAALAAWWWVRHLDPPRPQDATVVQGAVQGGPVQRAPEVR